MPALCRVLCAGELEVESAFGELEEEKMVIRRCKQEQLNCGEISGAQETDSMDSR